MLLHRTSLSSNIPMTNIKRKKIFGSDVYLGPFQKSIVTTCWLFSKTFSVIDVWLGPK